MIWEIIDVNQRVNFPMYYPIEGDLGPDRKPLYDVLTKAMRDQKITEVVPDLIQDTEIVQMGSLNQAKLKIPENEIQAMVEKIEDFMLNHKPFIDQHYSIHDLSQNINIPVYQLSPIINNFYQTNFNSWLNKYRVDYFIKLSGTNGKSELTLDAIAKEAGFSNRTTFTNAFKKEKGTTPGQFIKSLQYKH